MSRKRTNSAKKGKGRFQHASGTQPPPSEANSTSEDAQLREGDTEPVVIDLTEDSPLPSPSKPSSTTSQATGEVETGLAQKGKIDLIDLTEDSPPPRRKAKKRTFGLPDIPPDHPSDPKKKKCSFVFSEKENKYHTNGVNSLQYDSCLGRLYSAGRDSIIRIWNVRNPENPYVHSLVHHKDWVNDIVLCCGGRILISASSDAAVKVWNVRKGYCMSTLTPHKDQVKALAYAENRNWVASAGLDKAIFLWDVKMLTALTFTDNTVACSVFKGNNSSSSLAMNSSGNVIVSGSTKNVITVLDPRTGKNPIILEGHYENVKALTINKDGTQCLSGSSDGTIRLWSLGERKCVATIHTVHDEVWALQTNDSFTTAYSGGRDGKIFKIDLKKREKKALIGKETAPVLKMVLTPDDSSLWVATTDSSIKNWSLCHNISMVDYDMDVMPALNKQAQHVIKGSREEDEVNMAQLPPAESTLRVQSEVPKSDKSVLTTPTASKASDIQTHSKNDEIHNGFSKHLSQDEKQKKISSPNLTNTSNLEEPKIVKRPLLPDYIIAADRLGVQERLLNAIKNNCNLGGTSNLTKEDTSMKLTRPIPVASSPSDMPSTQESFVYKEFDVLLANSDYTKNLTMEDSDVSLELSGQGGGACGGPSTTAVSRPVRESKKGAIAFIKSFCTKSRSPSLGSKIISVKVPDPLHPGKRITIRGEAESIAFLKKANLQPIIRLKK